MCRATLLAVVIVGAMGVLVAAQCDCAPQTPTERPSCYTAFWASEQVRFRLVVPGDYFFCCPDCEAPLVTGWRVETMGPARSSIRRRLRRSHGATGTSWAGTRGIRGEMLFLQASTNSWSRQPQPASLIATSRSFLLPAAGAFVNAAHNFLHIRAESWLASHTSRFSRSKGGGVRVALLLLQHTLSLTAARRTENWKRAFVPTDKLSRDSAFPSFQWAAILREARQDCKSDVVSRVQRARRAGRLRHASQPLRKNSPAESATKPTKIPVIAPQAIPIHRTTVVIIK